MSRYAVYELFDGCSAPENIASCGHLAGVLVGKSDENPLDRHVDMQDKHSFQVLNEFNPEINIRTAKE